jgi:hypothetical protein
MPKNKIWKHPYDIPASESYVRFPEHYCFFFAKKLLRFILHQKMHFVGDTN